MIVVDLMGGKKYPVADVDELEEVLEEIFLIEELKSEPIEPYDNAGWYAGYPVEATNLYEYYQEVISLFGTHVAIKGVSDAYDWTFEALQYDDVFTIIEDEDEEEED